jgi:hypothetical protein
MKQGDVISTLPNNTRKRKIQTARGGGTGGSQERNGAEVSTSLTTSERPNASLGTRRGDRRKSILRFTDATADFFSDFLAAAMALHRQQGCLPSNVLETAWEKDPHRRLLASIVVHATVCSAAHCSPVTSTRAMTTVIFPQRRSTRPH